jgi:hypothetical protein
MNTIYKYHLPVQDEVTIDFPRYGKVLSVGVQHGETYIWAAVTTTDEVCRRRFHWRGTGHDINGLSNFVGTVQLHGGALVFHLFEGVTLL